MNRPPCEVADIIRQYGNRFIAKNRSWLTWLHLRVLYAIEFCRTASLGGHLDRCSRCGHEAISFNSCRNRHCPKCQTNARDKWLAGRSKELLPVNYVHVVFTLPHELSWLILQNQKVIYDLLFRTTAATLLEIAADPRHLGAEIGFLSVLHTWGQNLLHHPHIHCVIPSGGLSLDHQHWVHPRYPFGSAREFVKCPIWRGLERLCPAEGRRLARQSLFSEPQIQRWRPVLRGRTFHASSRSRKKPSHPIHSKWVGTPARLILPEPLGGIGIPHRAPWLGRRVPTKAAGIPWLQNGEIDQFPDVEESGMLPSHTARQPGNIEARETISGIPEQPHKLASRANSMKG